MVRVVKMVTSVGVPLATLYGIEPLLARHVIEALLGPLGRRSPPGGALH